MFVQQFDETVGRFRRTSHRGRIPDRYYDLARSAIVFYGAGLDAVVDRMLGDTGTRLVPSDFLSRSEGRHFITKVARVLRAIVSSPTYDESIPAGQLGASLAQPLMSDSPRSAMCEMMVEEMSDASFQSVERLYGVCNVFGLDPGNLMGPCEPKLRAALEMRNVIVHEMDVDLSQRTRTGRPRSRDEVREHITALLEVATDLIETADRRLAGRSAAVARGG